MKIAHTETGNVEAKIGVPLFKYVFILVFSSNRDMLLALANYFAYVFRSKIDPTCILHALSPQTLLLATDSSALYLYDLRASPSSAGSKPQQTHHPHDDYISSLTPIPPGDASTSGLSKQWVSTGGNTVAVTDLRRGILVKSEDQEEELLSSNIVGNKLVVGDAKGVLRMWEVGVWDDNEETVGLGKGASADVLTAVPEGLGNEQMAAVGMDDGYIRLVAMGGKRAKVVVELRHDEVEGVGALGFEVGGRMISGGGAVVKVWEENLGGNEGDEADNDIENGGEERGAENGKRANGSGSDKNDGSEVGGDESSDEEKPKRKKKKRKRNKGKDRSGGQHVMAFKGLD